MKKLAGINIQFPISQLILSGEKSVETRTYPIPKKYLGRKMLIVETPGDEGNFKSRIVGVIVFSECFKYENEHRFNEDFERHKVTRGSKWAWGSKPKWGWKIASVEAFSKPRPINSKIGRVYTAQLSIDL